jgi:hypothetical protein
MGSLAPFGMKFGDELALLCDLPLSIRDSLISFRQALLKGRLVHSKLDTQLKWVRRGGFSRVGHSTTNLCDTYIHVAGLYNCLHRPLKIRVSRQCLMVHVGYRGLRRQGKIDKQDCNIECSDRNKWDQNSDTGFA